MNPVFNILTPGVSYLQSCLLVKISEQGISFIAINQNQQCNALAMYAFNNHFTQDEIGDKLKELVSEQAILQQSFKKTTIVYGFAESLHIPEIFYTEDLIKGQMDLLFGEDADSKIATYHLQDALIHQVYRISKSLDGMTAQLFPKANRIHLYALLPQIINTPQHLLYCIFGNFGFTVVLQKDSHLQLIQQFSFVNPEDISYYLLNLCQRFEVNINHTQLQLNGMIDENSDNYKEIYKYFPDPVFGVLPKTFEYSAEIKKHPVHHFSHLFELAACV